MTATFGQFPANFRFSGALLATNTDELDSWDLSSGKSSPSSSSENECQQVGLSNGNWKFVKWGQEGFRMVLCGLYGSYFTTLIWQGLIHDAKLI